MKKLMMMAMMMVASATAFAGDSPALKAILKAKSYAEAQELLNSSLSQLTSDAEKAKAYNKLVDLAMDDYNKQSTIVTENQLAKQMGKEEKPVDNAAMSAAAFNAVQYAIECDKYDQLPNEKGKVSPKFASKNAQRVWGGARMQLVNAGQDALTAKDQATARKYWQAFVESDAAPLFKECDRTSQAPFFGQVARFAAIFAYQDKDMVKALQLADVALKDSAEYESALNLKLEILGSDLKTKADTLQYAEKLKGIYAEHKTNGVMEKLYNTYLGLGQTDEANKLLDSVLAADPNNFVALADKGLALLTSQKAAEAIQYLEKAFNVKPDNAVIATYTGTAYSVQAQDIEDPAKKKELYKKAIGYFDKAKELDPDRMQSNWGYNRYNAYYNYYGAEAPETKQAEADSKN